jgi:hypothetical protein
MSTGPTDPNPAAPRTIGDAIKAKTDAEQARQDATDALAAANQTLTDATAADDRARAELATDLFEVGTVFHMNDDGTAEVYISNSPTAYHHFSARPDSTPVDGGEPTPTSPPEPTPGPGPTPEPGPIPPAPEPTP